MVNTYLKAAGTLLGGRLAAWLDRIFSLSVYQITGRMQEQSRKRKIRKYNRLGHGSRYT
jgi:hypothetical protein